MQEKQNIKHFGKVYFEFLRIIASHHMTHLQQTL